MDAKSTVVKDGVVWIADAAIAAITQAGDAAPAGFDGGDPADYPAANWAPYDEVVKLAAADGMGVDFTLSGGAPRWAEGTGTALMPRI